MSRKIAELLARFDPEKHRHQLMLDDAPVGSETGGEEPCPRCRRVVLAGGCPYGHDDCPQFATGIKRLSPEDIEKLPLDIVRARLRELGYRI